MHPPKTPPPPTMSVRSQSPDIPQPVVYARLHHFRGKSSAAKEGRSKQVYNVDALQVVFGREESCDIRIYADNVSRKHCMIVVDLLTGKATLHVLSSHGLKLNRVPLPGGTIYTLQNDDIINVMDRKFRFEYASGSYEDQDDSSLSTTQPSSPSSRSSAFRPSLVQPILPPSPGINHLPSPARRSTRIPGRPLRNAPSTRMHLFPKDYASEEVRAALGDIGVDMEGRSEEAREEMPRKGRKEDFVYLEDREEEDAEEQQARGEEVSSTAVQQVYNTKKAMPMSSFSTPQPARKVTRVPRTSLAPRTRKMDKPTAHDPQAKSNPVQQLPQTPSSIPLPPPAETPYFSAPQPSTPSTPSIYPSLEQLNVFSAPQTPTPQSLYSSAYQTPRNVPLPEGSDTPYGSFVIQTPQPATTWEMDPALVSGDTQQETSQVEDVEMEDVSEYQDEQEYSRSPAPHVLALAKNTPRNVPLPMGGATPYTGAPGTPVSAFTQSEPTSPEEAASSGMPETPRAIRPLDGQVSLRRRLLLRSAHKVMQEQISRRDMRRTMGVGSGLIGTPMRPARGVDRSSMVISVSQPMSPITESAPTQEVPQTPAGQSERIEMQMTPSRVALPSPGGTEYDVSLAEEEDEEPTPMEDYAEPLRDHDESDGEHVSLAMYQTDAGEDEEGEDEDAEGETDHEEDAVYVGESLSSPATPMRDDNVGPQQDAVFASMDGDDAIQFRSPSASQHLCQSNIMNSVSDDDDLVDRSLDIAPDMEEASDVESGGQSEGEQGRAEGGEDDMRSESEEEEEDKENEPLEPSEQGEEEQGDVAQEAPSIPSSPSRAIRRPMVEEYYTPQPLNRKTDRRGMFGRKSLSSFGGPAVRGTPRSDMAPMKNAFARMSIGERPDGKSDPEDEETELEEQGSPSLIAAKVEADFSDAETHAVPASPRHPAMNVADNETPEIEIIASPLQGLKNKLKDMRRKSIHVKTEDVIEEKPFNRRATFGVSAPETPNTRETRFDQRGMNSAAPMRRFMPRLERHERHEQEERLVLNEDFAAEEADEEEKETLHVEDDMGPASEASYDSQSQSGDEDEGDEDQEREQSPGPLDEDEHRSEDANDMEDTESKDDDCSVEEVAMPRAKIQNGSAPVTPMLKGMREMLRTPKAAPETPRFSGMKHMFTVKHEMATPEMSGIVNLFPELQPSSHEESAEEQSAKISTTTKAASKLPTRNRPAAGSAKDPAPARTGVRAPTAASRSRAKPEGKPVGAEGPANKPATSTSSAGIRRVRADPPAATSSTIKSKVTRTRQAQELTVSTSTDEPSGPVKKSATRAGRARTAKAEPEAKPVVKAPSKVTTRALPARTTRARSAAPTEAIAADDDVEADPLDDINVPEPDPEDIKPVRKATRTATASRTATTRPLAARSALPQASQKADSPEPEKPKTRTRATATVASRLPKSSTEVEEVSAPALKRATRAAAASRLTAPTASSKARAATPPTMPPAPVRKTRAAVATTGPMETAEPSGIPKRVTRARK